MTLKSESISHHIGRKGVGVCTATVKSCPYGDESNHYSSFEEAQAVFESANAPKLFAAFKKDPYTAHLRRAEKRIRQIEDELKVNELRQGKETVYATHAELIPDLDLLINRSYFPRDAGVGIAVAPGQSMRSLLLQDKERENADPLLGILYVPDHRSEEERGIPEMAKLLREGGIGKDAVTYEETSEGMGVFRITTSADVKDAFKHSSFEATVERYVHYSDYRIDNLNKEVWDMTPKEIAGVAAERGLVLPKSDFAARTVIAEQLRQETIPQAKGDFSNGSTLTIVSDDEVHKAIMRASLAAHETGNLRLGNSLSSGVVFYDVRDASRQTREDAIYKEEANKASNEMIAPLKKELSKYGTVFAMGAQATEDTRDIRDVRYAVNFAPRAHRKDQIFGRFTRREIEELIEQNKFDDDVDSILRS